MRRIGAPARARWLLFGVAVAIFVPLLVLLVQVLANRQTAPGGDQALIQLRVSDVFTSHTPLVGSYQRFGWNQPGPAYLYLLAVPYRLFGSDYAALQAGAIVINALAVGGVLVVAYRRGGPALYLWSAALLAVVMHAMEPFMLASPWEPDISVLALLLLVFLVFDLARGRAWTIPIAAVVAAVLVQGWATTAPIAVALLAWGIVAYGFGWFSAPPTAGEPAPGRSWRRPALVAVGVVLVLLVPPVLQELRSDPGNITLMARFFRHSHEVLGLPDAYRLMSLQLGTRPMWAGARLPLMPFEAVVNPAVAPVVPIVGLLLLAAVIFAGARRDRSLALGLTAVVAVVAEVVALSRLVGAVFVEIMQPTWAVGAAAALAAGWCAYAPLRGTFRERVAMVVAPVLAVAVLGFGVANVALALDGPPPPPREDQVVQTLAERAVNVARAAHGPVKVSSPGPGQLGVLGTQLVGLVLDRAGVDVVVDTALAHRFGAFRAEPDRAVLELRLTPASSPPVGNGWRVVATLDPLTARQRAERDRLGAELDARLGTGLSDAERLRRLDGHPELARLATRYAALAQPALSISARPRPSP
jgi:hypothetical protein